MGRKWLRKFLIVSHFSHLVETLPQKIWSSVKGEKPLQHMPSDALLEGSMSFILLQEPHPYIAEGATVAL